MKLIIITFVCFLWFNSCLAQFQLDDSGVISTVKVQEVSSKEVLFAQDEMLRLTPASLTKVITTATAIELLGADYRYETHFCYTGEIKDGVLHGDVLVKSSGDPTMGSKYFEETSPSIILSDVVNVLSEAGISSIKGGVIVESDSIPYAASRLWEDMGNYYGASPHGFNWMDNTIELTLQSGDVGSFCKVFSAYPNFRPFALDCRVKAASHTNDSAYVYGVKEIQKWWIEGSIPSNRRQFKIKAAMPSPKDIFKEQLLQRLSIEGITVGNEISLGGFLDEDSEPTLFYTYHSPFLSEIIKIINHKSNNLFADQLLLSLAKEVKGKATWDLGNLVVREFWQNKIDFKNNFRLRDGSGLSPKNLISANGMVQLLSWMQMNSSDFSTYAQSLAKGGESGTLRSVFKHAKLKGKVIGKSGSFEGVLGYCGYLTTQSGKKAAFCIIANNYLVPTKQVRKSMDEIITDIVIEN